MIDLILLIVNLLVELIFELLRWLDFAMLSDGLLQLSIDLHLC